MCTSIARDLIVTISISRGTSQLAWKPALERPVCGSLLSSQSTGKNGCSGEDICSDELRSIHTIHVYNLSLLAVGSSLCSLGPMYPGSIFSHLEMVLCSSNPGEVWG